MTPPPTLLWLRRDLRLADHPAIDDARHRGGAVIPVFIHAPEEERPWAPGSASRWWLHHSLEALNESLRKRGSRLIIRAGKSLAELLRLLEETGAKAVVWSRLPDPHLVDRDRRVETALRERGIETRTHGGALLHEPDDILNQSGEPYRVFTAFWRQCTAQPEPDLPLAAPRKIPAPRKWPRSESLESLGLLPKVDWAGGLREAWQPGEEAARRRLRAFVKGAIETYDADRERPALVGTSRLSPHLHFGEITPRQIWHAVREAAGRHRLSGDAQRFLTEVGWREFAHHLLHHFPHTAEQPLRPEFERFPWRDDSKALRVWQRGETGYPIVDAGMRELWRTGWMHNRVRMIVASFLVKDLLIPWQRGAEWFWDTLVDADLANNTLGWQWTAGCGADAAPFFRIFNPVLQGEKFDPEGAYVRRWCPELDGLPHRLIHRPWEASSDTLADAGISLGDDYPEPLVDHPEARDRALEAFQRIKR
ncbi:deoxyribodipyrimidine photo-lyase [Candidatus Sumerlaeota bacterium]|nr:deoxyribodipyrimidine photo-lyase [Candidatus Sumerlaeota bacterium]